MNANQKATGMADMKVRLSTLWVFVMINMLMADIVTFMNPGALGQMIAGDMGFQVTQEILLVFSILLEIPIVMILLSRVLNHRANRWANMIAGVITILFVIGGGSPYLSYIFFATIEVVSMAFIVWQAWKWTAQEA